MSVWSFTARKTSRKEAGILIVILLLSSIFTFLRQWTYQRTPKSQWWGVGRRECR
jgi:hypothetical protein